MAELELDEAYFRKEYKRRYKEWYGLSKTRQAYQNEIDRISKAEYVLDEEMKGIRAAAGMFLHKPFSVSKEELEAWIGETEEKDGE